MKIAEIKDNEQYKELLKLSFVKPVVLMVEMDGCIACYFAQDKFKSISAEFPEVYPAKMMKDLFYQLGKISRGLPCKDCHQDTSYSPFKRIFILNIP
ncbi:unnamed protein product [Hymenolepis diminuta]|uniref:Thioredoxin-like fold domain-containing protein n=1 Tax=Hymenolepis diminuta TaxID=6216 RepID=A0A564YZL3_HYMDI|nr:unnamed protein product [Hymenolepis diminuta]